jgi:predicted DNA-binding mobile mystery protein A
MMDVKKHIDYRLYFCYYKIGYNILKNHMKKVYELLSIRQLDEKLKPLKDLKTMNPTSGWIRYIRESLCLPASRLGLLLNMKQPSVVGMEENERNKKITLETLEKAANAMGCDLVYAFVPKSTMRDFICEKQKTISQKIIQKANHTMNLEKQGLIEKDLKQQQEVMEEGLSHESLKVLWRYL